MIFKVIFQFIIIQPLVYKWDPKMNEVSFSERIKIDVHAKYSTDVLNTQLLSKLVSVKNSHIIVI